MIMPSWHPVVTLPNACNFFVVSLMVLTYWRIVSAKGESLNCPLLHPYSPWSQCNYSSATLSLSESCTWIIGNSTKSCSAAEELLFLCCRWKNKATDRLSFSCSYAKLVMVSQIQFRTCQAQWKPRVQRQSQAAMDRQDDLNTAQC